MEPCVPNRGPLLLLKGPLLGGVTRPEPPLPYLPVTPVTRLIDITVPYGPKHFLAEAAQVHSFCLREACIVSEGYVTGLALSSVWRTPKQPSRRAPRRRLSVLNALLGFGEPVNGPRQLVSPLGRPVSALWGNRERPFNT